eukprot:757924-Hanusia_phi.AAC.1
MRRGDEESRRGEEEERGGQRKGSPWLKRHDPPRPLLELFAPISRFSPQLLHLLLLAPHEHWMRRILDGTCRPKECEKEHADRAGWRRRTDIG